MSDLRDKARFKEKLQEVASTFQMSLTANAPAYAGAEFTEPLEHVTRRHLIDIFLIALGWNLDRQGHEILEEAQVKGETTLFLDYLGVNPASRAPLFIVEAKAWAKPFVSASAATIDRSGAKNAMDGGSALIARAVDHVNKGEKEGSSPVTLEWTRWIAKLRDYVQAVYNNSGYCAQRMVITSGQWLVIFCNPAATFLEDGEATASGILCFCGDELIERSDQIHDLLAREMLIRNPPERLRPAQLTAYVGASDVAHVFRALWVVHRVDGAHFDVHPQLTVYAALVIQRRDGLLVTVVDDGPRLSVPYDMDDLSQHTGEVAEHAERLLQAVNQELSISAIPTGIEKFPGFGGRPYQLPAPDMRPPPPRSKIELLKSSPRHPNEFLLVTGAHPHFLHLRPIIENCRFHDWSACHSGDQHQGANPIAVRSVKPRSFFYSTEEHHCAHRQVHDRRRTRCQIDAFEEFLCCRACTLQTFCWSQADVARLPCSSTV